MPRRSQILATKEIYHVFNRSVGNEEILSQKRNLSRVFKLIDYYRFPQKIRHSKFKSLKEEFKKDYLSNMRKQSPLVEIFAFALMPNHYHFLLKQLRDRGIYRFISNFQNSFAKYFNLKNNRHGALFQNAFKAKRIETDEEFTHLSRYIHLNPVTSYLIEFVQLSTYPWTSFSWYVDEKINQFVNTEGLTGLFESRKKYLKFVADQADYQRKLQFIKRLIIE